MQPLVTNFLYMFNGEFGVWVNIMYMCVRELLYEVLGNVSENTPPATTKLTNR